MKGKNKSKKSNQELQNTTVAWTKETAGAVVVAKNLKGTKLGKITAFIRRTS